MRREDLPDFLQAVAGDIRRKKTLRDGRLAILLTTQALLSICQREHLKPNYCIHHPHGILEPMPTVCLKVEILGWTLYASGDLESVPFQELDPTIEKLMAMGHKADDEFHIPFA